MHLPKRPSNVGSRVNGSKALVTQDASHTMIVYFVFNTSKGLSNWRRRKCAILLYIHCLQYVCSKCCTVVY